MRSLLLLIAVGALLAVYLKPSYRAKGAATTIVLNGQATNQLDSLLEHYPAARVLSLQPHSRYSKLEGLSYLSRYAAPGSRIFLLGEGLPEQEAAFLRGFAFHYLPAAGPAGVQQLYYQTRPRQGDSLQLEGSWFAPAANHRLVLAQGSMGLDSIVATEKGIKNFRLNVPLFFTGRQLYHLHRISQQGDTLETYRLPLKVQEAASYQLALLTAYPEAESKYLKEFLGAQGLKLYYAAQLAPGKEIKEWINLPQQSVQYTPASLAAWDVFIMSLGAYIDIGRGRQQALTQAIQQSGVGLLLYPDADQNSINWEGSQLRFAPESVRDTFSIAGERISLEYRPLQALPPGWQVVLRRPKGIVAASVRKGLGKVVAMGSQASYTMLLKGQEQQYQQYWSYLLQEVLPLEELKVAWEAGIGATQQLPFRLSLSSQDSLPSILVTGPDQQPLYPASWQHAQFQDQWTVQFWPRQKGWYTAQAAGDTLSFWVSEKAPAIVQAEMQQHLHERSVNLAAEAFPESYEQKPVPLWWFYLLFLAGMGGLWYENKRNG